MKKSQKIKEVIRSQLQPERIYSFVIARRKHARVKAENFGKALDKVLSLNPSKRVRYNLKFYLMKDQEGMDLMSAKVEAATKSKSTGKKVYIFMNDEGDHFLADQAVAGTVAVYSNGSELVEERPTAPITPAKKAEVKKQVAKKEETAPVKKVTKTKTEKVMAKATKKSAKKVAPKKAAAPAKKEAPKKVASNLISKATTLSLTAAQWKKLEEKGSVRTSANEAVIAYHKL